MTVGELAIAVMMLGYIAGLIYHVMDDRKRWRESQRKRRKP